MLLSPGSLSHTRDELSTRAAAKKAARPILVPNTAGSRPNGHSCSAHCITSSAAALFRQHRSGTA